MRGAKEGRAGIGDLSAELSSPRDRHEPGNTSRRRHTEQVSQQRALRGMVVIEPLQGDTRADVLVTSQGQVHSRRVVVARVAVDATDDVVQMGLAGQQRHKLADAQAGYSRGDRLKLAANLL